MPAAHNCVYVGSFPTWATNLIKMKRDYYLGTVLLEVHSCGLVYRKAHYIESNIKGKSYKRFIPEKLCSPVDNGLGYLQIKVQKDKKIYRKYLHVIVWEAYNGSIPKDLEIDHKDNNKRNCSLDNLQLLSRKDNMKKMLNNNLHVLHNLI